MDIGTKLKSLRTQNGLTQQELADRAELTKGFISQVERNLTSPSISTLADILQCLGSSLQEFFTDDTPEQIVFREEGVMRPGIVHRIDMDTTGAIVICKNDMAHQSLADQLKEHSITRKYRALVHGNLKEDEGTVEGPIGRHATDRKRMAINYKNGKPAVTHYKVLERFGAYTFIECQLETGRTHQIRVHMASIGHQLVGDITYGPAKCPFKHLQGQCLHAMVLGFVHPRTNEYI